MNVLPTICPSCGEALGVKRLVCRGCDTEVDGLYSLPDLVGLPKQDQEFALLFIKASGSLKEMARLTRVSYPTVRNRLDDIIEKLKQSETAEKEE